MKIIHKLVSRQTLLLFQTDADGCLVIGAEQLGAVGDNQCELLAQCDRPSNHEVVHLSLL